MTLHDLIERTGLEVEQDVNGDLLAAAVSGIAYDSRAVNGGEVFVAIKGECHDGMAFVDHALSRGAIAVVAEVARSIPVSRPWLRVADARAALAALAATFHGNPSHELLVIGTTGTNGKTTTTYLIEAILEQAGIPCGRISSVSYRISEEEQPALHTTPEAPELQTLLSKMVKENRQACVMEVSSHALAMKRVLQTRFGAAVFTNLTRDHLDFHGDMTKYFQAKRKLFSMICKTSPAVLNMDDLYGKTLISEVAWPVTYAIDQVADVMPERLVYSLDGIEMNAQTTQGSLRLRSRLLGRGNAYNVLAATATGTALSIPSSAIEKGIAAVEHVPGRMQLASRNDDDVTVLVDFAHTDDALRSLLETSRSITRGRIITVFGCGGDRDSTKRPLMGAVASRLSDLVIVTSDNPRSEDPEHIAKEIITGLKYKEGDDAITESDGLKYAQTPWLTILNRDEAIGYAIREADAGDLVVIAGKGHEQYQLIGTRTVPFDDTAIAREALIARRSSASIG